MSVPVLSSSSQLSIKGIHASNVSSTPIISSYPTSTTSTSIGHYHFLDNNNATNHLNISASGQGGHIFSHVSSVDEPATVLKVDRTALTLNSSIRNTSSKTILDLTENKLFLNNIDNSVSSNINPDAVSFSDTNQGFSGALTSQQLFLNLPATQVLTRAYAGEIQITDLMNANKQILTTTNLEITNLLQTVKSNLSKDNLTITDISNNVSILSSSDLKFNNISLPSTVSTNTQNIATNTTDIQNLKNKDLQNIVSQITLSSPAIYADSAIAPQPSQFLANFGYSGWGYQKKSPQASNAKINYYFPFPKFNGTVGDLKGLYYQIFNNCSGAGDLPFFTVYTKPTGVNDYRSWYHSSNTYVATTNSPANQTCQMFMNIKNLNYTPYSVNVQNQISMSQSTVSNPKGTYTDTDEILFIAFGTNSASALNAVDFVVSKIGIITDFTTEILLL